MVACSSDKDHDAGGAASCGAVYFVFCPYTPSFSVASLSIHGLDTLTLSPQVDAVVRTYNNANKKTCINYHGGGEVTVSYSSEQLATGPCPAFHQAPRNITVFSMALRQREKAERSGGHPKEEGDKEWRTSDTSARVERL
ncbi:hypothetical protein E2562_037864 [Oryza meyeriana var. granulata]|uniref:Uncharacterized protein n=1 Tax=Oryza meyeriana var. granulata TaxID=110450 RepID=A0A6G1C2D3_9ORYZ|nr:hypothetical protein E2562_037864 [Oryza meyeriana var. granulata]